MQLKEFKPRKALNKAFLKIKPSRSGIESFKTNLIRLLETTNDTESEEFHKNIVSDFLKRTYYDSAHFINTKGRNDLVIHNGVNASTSVGVIIEAKKPTNKSEMVTRDKLNVKAFQELILYYLRERITHKNLEVRNLIITNINEWYIFDANTFEKIFAQNNGLVKQFTDFEEGRLAGKQTDFFYREIAAPFIENITREIEFTYFDIREYDKPLRNDDKSDDNSLIALYKLLSPEHLLKLPFANDSNSLDKRFYSELLHIIGLTETKDGGKKIIGRKKEGERNTGSILEDAIIQLDSLDKIGRLEKPSQFGSTHGERLFNVGLELSITWINRILFLKLLEAQLISYHKGDRSYAFLNASRIREYDDLNSLFFQVLARRHDQRNDDVKMLYEKVPYLNSSLFEPTDLEHSTLLISNLKDDKTLPVLSTTVLSDGTGKKRTGTLTTLQYLFEFLDSYDFSSEGSEDIQEDNKTLINASVLGLIFEKINGYKDGSFFTPGFITMYMCRETIRRAVVQKFNDAKSWNCETIEQLYDKIEDRAEANSIVNSLRICDPAVGSGHFLVSALNEMIAVKHDLKILSDRSGARLKEYQFEVVNDELIVTDEDGRLFEYHRNSAESQRVQETLFHEKQTIIENCLFGVDINPNSVKICRLRLWIELLKNAYYRNATELETLPNIDINIKCGNSLVSRFAIDADLGQALKKSKWNIDSYKLAVDTYRNAKSKEEKRAMEKLIADIKTDFRSEISLNDKMLIRYRKLSGELFGLTNQTMLFEQSKKEKADWNKQVQKLTDETKKLETEIEEIKNNKIFENAFEWRFEFPEVLDNDGKFVGFDVVIGNPPYGVKFTESEKDFFKTKFVSIHSRTPESYNYFVNQLSKISHTKGLCCVIIPSSFLTQIEFEKSRYLILSNHRPFLVLNLGDAIFDDVATPTCIVGFGISNKLSEIFYDDLAGIDRNDIEQQIQRERLPISTDAFLSNPASTFVFRSNNSLIDKCYKNRTILKDVAEEVATGVSTGFDKAYVFKSDEISSKKLENSLLKKLVVGGEILRYHLKPVSGKQIIYITNEIDIDDYPFISQELLNHKEVLLKRREAANGKIKWYSLNWPRRKKLFETPKILIRQTANKIMAAYDNENWFCLKSGIIIQLPDNSSISYNYLVGILNSKLMDFLYHDLVNEDNRIFPEVKPIQLFKLPIHSIWNQLTKDIDLLSIKIRQMKEIGNDSTGLESQIDQLVYQLYGLTEEEIAIVEEAVK